MKLIRRHGTTQIYEISFVSMVKFHILQSNKQQELCVHCYSDKQEISIDTVK